MTDPIARGNPFRSDRSSASSNESPSESRVPAADGAFCRERSPASPYFDDATPTTRGTDALVSQNHSSGAARFATHQSPHAPEDGVSDPEPERSPPTNNNAQRTAAMKVTGGHADAGITSSGDSVYASVAGIKGRTPDANVEVLSASVQVGSQNEAQVGLARVAMSSEFVSGDVRTLEAECHAGIHNPDGSVGINAGYSASFIAAELTVGTPALSLTVAGALGDGEETSVGLRDANHNGNVELCFRRSVSKFIVVGACVEPAAVTAGVRELYDAVVSKFNRETPVQ